ISKKIYSLLWPSSKTIGVLSSLEVFGGADNPYLAQMLAAQGRQPPRKWTSLRLMEERYDVRRLDDETENISPDDIDLVVVIHPKGLSDKALWALDEWIVRGGDTLVFLDPYALDDRAPQNPQQPWAALQYQPASNLEPLLSAWGFSMPDQEFAADPELAVRRSVDARSAAEPVIIDLAIDEQTREQTLDTTHPVFEGLQELRFFLAGALEQDAESDLEAVALVTTTGSGNTLTIEPGFGGNDKLAYTDLNSPAKLRDAFSPGAGPVVLGYQISGRFPSAYPEGTDYAAETPETPPGLPPGVKLPPPEDAEMIHQDPVPEEERGDATVIVIADVDLISDQVAFQQNILGLTLAANDNYKLLLNGIDYLLGSKELMNVRAKHEIRRPFTLFNEIEATAEQQSLDRERQLREDIEEAEKQLQAKRQELAGQDAALFQKKLQDEVDRLNETVREANRELREIRKGRREALAGQERKVRRSVMGWMPTLVLAIGIALAVRRRRLHKEAMGGDRS
ncbi:MAG: Gldg family protein, partial [Acidobacteriota bacterium]